MLGVWFVIVVVGIEVAVPDRFPQKVADERFRNRMLARSSVWTCPNVASILRSDTLRDKDRVQCSIMMFCVPPRREV